MTPKTFNKEAFNDRLYQFEYDSNKSAINMDKHGMDFKTAQAIWSDPFCREMQLKHSTEDRYLVIGKIQQQVWSAIITYRDENIRLISVRRARRNEIETYRSRRAGPDVR
jgi:uncharacterized protein